MDTFTDRRRDHPPKRQKLPLHLHPYLHYQQIEEPADHVLASSPHFNFLPPAATNSNTPPFAVPSLFNHENRLANGDDNTLSLSLSSDQHPPRCDEHNRCVVSCQDTDGWKWRSSVPLGPFTGYASILNRSTFLKPAQDLLDELCGVESNIFRRNYSLFHGDNLDLIHSDDYAAAAATASKDCKEIQLLDEVFKRYKQYYQHLLSVVASFEAVCGLGNAAPCISFALSTMSQQFSSLKKTLFERAQIAGEAMGYSSVNSATLGCKDLHTNKTSSAVQHPVWRSQRGLPAYAVAVFKNWLFEHFLHPYPSDTDKNLLAQQTGLSRNQVSNWFINARVRLWKPLVEEIHTLDEQQGQPKPTIKNDLKTSKATALHQPPGTQHTEHQARTAPLPMSRRFDPSCSESSTDYISTTAMKHDKPNENMDITLALGLQHNSVSRNNATTHES